ncbi:MAG: metallophosphoesterase [Candidatus Omnitrophota bacterium]
MKIGIFADTHDNLPKIEKAVTFFNKKKVDLVLHAGDFIAPFAAAKLNRLLCDFQGVFGNNDGERKGLIRVSQGKIQEGPLRITLDNRRIVLVHDINSVNPEAEAAELIIFGHSHKPEIIRKDSFLLVNPGECAGWTSDRSSVAIVDLDTLSPVIFDL